MIFFKNIKQQAKKLKLEVSTLALALKDRRTPIVAKIMIALTISYALSPVDLIPDFIPVLGYIDDLIILPLMIFISLKLIPKSILDECREKVKNDSELNKKSGIFAAIVIVLIWLGLTGSIIFWLVF